MKINKAKLLVGTLAVVATAATVGSISGTVAWFQYNTRATVNYVGASAHCSENLEVRIYDADLVGDNVTSGANEKYYPYSATTWASNTPSWGKWTSELKMADITSYIQTTRGAWDKTLTTAAWVDSTDSGLYPVTSQALALNAAPGDMYRNPIRGYTSKDKWGKADKTDYVELPLQFRVRDIDGADAGASATQAFLAKKIYLSDLVISTKSPQGKADITDAVRVALIGGTNSATFWHSATANAEVDVSGNLDLLDDGVAKNDQLYHSGQSDERLPYEFDASTDIKDAIYGDANAKAYATSLAKETLDTPNDVKIADDSDPYKIKGKEWFTTDEVSATATATINAKVNWTTVKVRIYLEGWQKLAVVGGSGTSAVWEDTDYVGAQFNIGMRFTAEAHIKH